MKINLNFNGKEMSVDTPSNLRLSVLIREILGKKSVKQSCDCGRCGFCLIILDDKPIYSCLFPASMAHNKKILTIESITQKSEYSNIIKGFELANVDLCPSCAPSRILLTYHLLEHNRELTGEMLNIISESISCDCTDTKSLKEALYLAASFYKGAQN